MEEDHDSDDEKHSAGDVRFSFARTISRGTNFEQDSVDHYINSKMDMKRSLLG